MQEGDEHRLEAPSLAVATVPEPAPLLQSPVPKDQLVFCHLGASRVSTFSRHSADLIAGPRSEDYGFLIPGRK